MDLWNSLASIVSIILIDLVLSGDNALVIGMAARDLPDQKRRLAIFWGTGAAILLRVTFTLIIALLLNIVGLRLVGGALLVWIAIKLLVKPPAEEEVETGRSLWEAIRIIVIADAVMSLDNMLAVAAAAHGEWALILFGLGLSIPILMGGAALVAYLMKRFPWITWLGGGVLAWVAGKMIVNDPLLAQRLDTVLPALQQLISLHLLIPLLITLGVVVVSYLWLNRRGHTTAETKH